MEQGSLLFDLDPAGQQRVETVYLDAGPGESVVAGLGPASAGSCARPKAATAPGSSPAPA
jgi:hypothetical protein